MASSAVVQRPLIAPRTGIRPKSIPTVRNPDFALYFLVAGILVSTTFAQSYYRLILVNLGVNIRLMDFIILSNLVLGVVLRLTATQKRRRATVAGEQIVILAMTAFLLIGSIETARGIPTHGSFAIGVARYTLLDLLWVPAIILIVDSEKRLSKLIWAVLTALPFCWLFKLIMFFGFGAHAAYDEGILEEELSPRFIDSYSAFGLAAFGAIAFPYAAVRWRGKEQLCYFSCNFIALLTLVGVAYCQSRSVWMGAVAGIFYLFCKLIVRTSARERRFVIRTFALTIVSATLAVMALVILAPSLGEQRLAFLTGLEKDSTGYWRVQGWIWVMRRVIVKNPVFGMGFGDIGFPDPSFPEKFLDVPDHNQYVTVFRSMGFLGLTLYLCVLLLAFRLGKRVFRLTSDPFSRLRVLGITTGLVMSVFYSFFYNHPAHIGWGIGLLFVCGRMAASAKLQHR